MKDDSLSVGHEMEGPHLSVGRQKENGDKPGVLIVEDDKLCLQMLGAYLDMEGFRVSRASNGFEALALLETCSFRFMLTDYNMPGMDGLKLSEKARTADPALIIIMLTGFPLELLAVAAVETGISTLLAKPYSISALLEVIKEHL